MGPYKPLELERGTIYVECCNTLLGICHRDILAKTHKTVVVPEIVVHCQYKSAVSKVHRLALLKELNIEVHHLSINKGGPVDAGRLGRREHRATLSRSSSYRSAVRWPGPRRERSRRAGRLGILRALYKALSIYVNIKHRRSPL